MIKLRDYQREAVDSVIHSLSKGGSTLLVMATGLGKTVVFAEIIRRYLSQGTGRRALVLAHRAELIQQAAATIGRIAGCDVEVEMGDLRVSEGIYFRAPVVVSSVQTQIAGSRHHNWKRMHKFKPEQFGIVIIDEAHHAVGESYKMILDYYSKGCPRILGVTATPDRKDEAALGQVFESVAFTYGLREAIIDGWLVPIKQRLVSVRSLDFSQCRTTAGDLNGADLDAVMQYEETLHGMIAPTLEIAKDKRGLIFAASVAHAERVCEIINRHKPSSAVCVTAATPSDERRLMFEAFSEGKHQWLVNVGVATEGWDDSARDGRGVQIIAMMRPTKSRALYCQMVGRGTRPLPATVDGLDTSDRRRAAIATSAKSEILILDYCGNAGRHKLIHATDALAGKEGGAAAERVRVQIETSEQDVDVLEMLTQEEIKMKAEVERAARKGIVVGASYKTQLIDPFSLVDLSPDRTQAWTKGRPASEKQLAVLRRLRVQIPDMLTRNEASKLIDAAVNTPSPAQAWVLRKAGLDPSDYTRRSASAKIDELREQARQP